MTIVKIAGGLGNQMFQYAFYLALKEKSGNVKLDISSFRSYHLHNGFELDKIFNIQYSNATNKERRELSNQGDEFIVRILRMFLKHKSTEFVEPFLGYNEDVFFNIEGRYFIGYWQSYKYFKNIALVVRNAFAFPLSLLSDRNKLLRKEIQKNNSVSIHVRLGDYVGHPLYSNICTLDYYRKAIDLIVNRIPDSTFFIFSNDTRRCLEKLNLPNCIVVDWNSGEDAYWDMYLMSCCKHNIIANSTFSWWGAWLNLNPSKIVVSPSKWINDERISMCDIIPPEWICI